MRGTDRFDPQQKRETVYASFADLNPFDPAFLATKSDESLVNCAKGIEELLRYDKACVMHPFSQAEAN